MNECVPSTALPCCGTLSFTTPLTLLPPQVRAIPRASTTACVPSLFSSQPAGWWLAVHVAGQELVTVLDDGARCQIRGQAAPHHGDINAAYIVAYIQDEVSALPAKTQSDTWQPSNSSLGLLLRSMIIGLTVKPQQVLATFTSATYVWLILRSDPQSRPFTR